MNMSLSKSSDLSVKNSISAVIEPLEDGLCSIKKIYEAFIDGDVDPNSGQCTNYKYIREQIVQAEKSLKQSEQAASTGLKFLDKNIEILTQGTGKLEQEMSATNQTLHNLRTEQTSNENLLRDSKASLELARINESSSRDTLQRQESRKENAKSRIITGLGVTLIPIVGWVAGPVMAITGVFEMCQASGAIIVAEEVRKFENEVNKYESKVSESKSKISQNKHDIRQKYDKVKNIRKEIQKVKEQREAVAELQSKVRSAVRILSDVSGKARVAEIQTRRFILQEPVLKVMEDLMKVAEEITENQLVFNKGRPKLFSVMREAQRLAAICASDNEKEGFQMNGFFKLILLIVLIFVVSLILVKTNFAPVFLCAVFFLC